MKNTVRIFFSKKIISFVISKKLNKVKNLQSLKHFIKTTYHSFIWIWAEKINTHIMLKASSLHQ